MSRPLLRLVRAGRAPFDLLAPDADFEHDRSDGMGHQRAGVQVLRNSEHLQLVRLQRDRIRDHSGSIDHLECRVALTRLPIQADGSKNSSTIANQYRLTTTIVRRCSLFDCEMQGALDENL